MTDSSATLELGPDRSGRQLQLVGDRVSLYGPSSAAKPPSDLRLDCSEGTLAPGRVNAHTHIYSGLAPLGMPPPEEEPSNFVEILERIWWRLDQALDAASLAASARLYVAEALLAGTSTLVDHHESPRFIEGSLDVLAEACHQLGIRAVLCFGATERNDGRREARRGLEECRRFILSNRRPLVRGVVGLHASFTVSDDTIREAGDLCRELGTVLHVHVAEDRADVVDAQRRGYRGPLERLLELGALPPGSILAHGIHLDRDQVHLALDKGLWFVQNPRSNRGNRVGYPAALVASSRVALGTDGYPARMDEEVAVLAEEAEAHGEDERIVEDRVTAGWRMLGELFGGPFAPLAPGAMADVGVVDGPASHLLVGGKLVVQDGELLTGDVEQIEAEAHAQAPAVWGRMKTLA
jgi:cytosine/adenosine deaminase-related metal-dependent hydrolase